METDRLGLLPLDPVAAAALPGDRNLAAQIIGTHLADAWPQPDLIEILPRQAALGPGDAHFGIWVIVERETSTVVGDAGFHGPPSAAGTVEIGYSIIPERRRRGFATEAGRALLAWAVRQPGVSNVVAGCRPQNAASIRTLEALGFHRTGMDAGELRWRL
jgi:RimJ/RimL family protein N-acetyltransferase